MTVDELFELKQNIENVKVKINKLQGSKEHLLKELKDDWKCPDVKQGEKKLKELGTALTELNTKLEEGLAELEELYGEVKDTTPNA